MDFQDDPAQVPAEDRLGLDENFRFECRPDLACFNQCCQDKLIPLWPLDVVYLKQALGVDSDAFLEQHGRIMPDPDTGWPLISLGMTEAGACPFVTDQGCRVYAARPTACRLFPLARALRITPAGKQDEFFYRLQAPGCLGLQEKRDLTVAQWIVDQDLAERQAHNERFEATLFPAGRKQAPPPEARQVQAVVLAGFNVDVFRAFVLKGGFLDKFQLNSDRIEAVRENDLAALDLGFDWLAHFIHGRPAPK
jgi:Fe-S-cluster containining protein